MSMFWQCRPDVFNRSFDIFRIDAGIFAISPDSLFPVGSLARYAIASSSAAVVVGIPCDVWLLFRYGWVEKNTCKVRTESLLIVRMKLKTRLNEQARAVDVFDSYMFFSLSARVPTLSALFSTFTLMMCIGSLAYNAFPVGVAIVFFLFGMLITLQFLVYGMRWFARAIARVIGGAFKLVSRLWTFGRVESKLERSPTVATVATTASTASSTATKKEVGVWWAHLLSTSPQDYPLRCKSVFLLIKSISYQGPRVTFTPTRLLSRPSPSSFTPRQGLGAP